MIVNQRVELTYICSTPVCGVRVPSHWRGGGRADARRNTQRETLLIDEREGRKTVCFSGTASVCLAQFDSLFSSSFNKESNKGIKENILKTLHKTGQAAASLT